MTSGTDFMYIQEDIFLESSFSDSVERVIIKIKQFIASTINALKDAKSKLLTTARLAALRTKLQLMKVQFKQAQKDGAKYVEMVDYERFVSYYTKYANEIIVAFRVSISDLQKLQVKDYRTKFDNQNRYLKRAKDIDIIVTEFSKELESILSKKKKIRTDKAIQFVEKEISGESKILKQSIGICNEMDSIMNRAEHIVKDSKASGDAYLQNQHMNIIHRGVHRFLRMINNAFSKFVRTVVFFFA